MILWSVFDPNTDDCEEIFCGTRQDCVDTMKDSWAQELARFQRQQEEDGPSFGESTAVDPREEKIIFLAKRLTIDSPISKATAIAMLNQTAYADRVESWRVTASKTGRLSWEELPKGAAQ